MSDHDETSSLRTMIEAIREKRIEAVRSRAENAQWLRFAQEAMRPAMDLFGSDDWGPIAKQAADFADAMLQEAKERGKI